ncbi:non-ribosomal peptide synthetase [Vibrio nigripulchritudo]|uniref:non-ribosomal peptide synthetase n=1 Tax=Vibrio nigripulchritudo TaxID=28173 RepID=UPI0003B22105|nr:AMP-binding protein [Vibrio nigripulchritudo]CCN73662.1 putative ANTIBIOTIC SYNTHETASE [Vibrio nigripulchritudo SFn118]
MEASIHLRKLSAKSDHVALPWIHQFELISKQYPDNKAILNPAGESYSYRELDSKANRLANYLREELGRLSPGHRKHVIALCTSRTNIEVATVFVAVLKLGAAIHLVEPKLGAEVNTKRLHKIAPDIILLDDENANLSSHFSGFKTLLLSEHESDISQTSDESVSAVGARHDACVFCSSGTTGEPKVISMPMLPLSNLTRTGNEELKLNHEARIIQLARRNFDAVVHELAIALGNGACLVLIDEQTMFCHMGFIDFIHDFHITHITITPFHVSHLLQTHEGNPNPIFAPVNTIMLVGEAFSDDLPHRLAKAGVSRIVNGYGPSEAGIWVMSAVLYDESISSEVIPTHLGKPIRGVDARVMHFDENTQHWNLCQQGEKGELLVSNRLQNVYKDQKNNQSRYIYIPDPVTDNIECFYRTGDIVEITPNGELVFVGRQDNQIKLSGQLVVTDEVANQLKDACTALFGDRAIEIYIAVERNSKGTPTSLTAYHTAHDPEDANDIACQLSDHLLSQIPPYMHPKRYAWMESFPIKVGGKLDTQAVISHAQDSKIALEPQTLPETITQLGIASIWQHVLSISDQIYLEHSFTDLGGTSLQTLSMLSEVNREFNTKIKADTLMNKDTLADLANAVEQAVRNPDAGKIVPPEAVNSLIEMQTSTSDHYLFLVHPGDGHVQVYHKLVGLIPENVNVYGLRAPGAESDEEIARFSVSEYAQRYADLIVEQQPEGDISILGYCAGAPISIEIARILESYGRKVGTLALVDLPNGYHKRENTDIAQGLTTFFRQMYGLNTSAEELRNHSMNPEDQFELLFDQAVTARLVEADDHQRLREALNGVMYEPEQEDPVETMHLFFKYAFKLDVNIEKLAQYETDLERLNYVVGEGQKLNLFPPALTADYFARLLAMENTTKDAVHGYVPEPLSIQGNILYLHASPSIENPMAWYPNPATWHDDLLGMEVLNLKGDHYSIVREEEDMRDLLKQVSEYLDFELS